MRANILALGCEGSDAFNVGTGIETDVNTLFRVLREQTGMACPEQHGPPKLGEQLRSVLNHEKITRVLGWRPATTLEEGLARTVAFFKGLPDYATPRR